MASHAEMTVQGKGNEDALATVLIVDDDETSRILMRETLEIEGYEVHEAAGGRQALAYLEENQPDLILLDIMMPEIGGYEVCQKLKPNKKLRDIPIIFVSALDMEDDETRGFSLGAVDYISKPISADKLKARVKTHIELKRHRDRLEAQNIELTKTAIELGQQLLKEGALEDRLNHLGLLDDFQGIYNRRIFMYMAENYLRLAERFQCRLFLLYIGIDNLDWIRENGGPGGYERAVADIVGIVRDTFRQSDISIFGLLGRGELVSLLLSSPDTGNAHPALGRLQEAIAGHNQSKEYDHDLSISTAIVPYGYDEPFSLEELIEKGRDAMLENRMVKDFEVEA